MKKRLLRFLGAETRFRKEFRKQIRMLIIVALGFTIAFTWRQTVFDISQSLVQFITDVKDSAVLSVLTSVFITITSIILIYFVAHFLKDSPDDRY